MLKREAPEHKPKFLGCKVSDQEFDRIRAVADTVAGGNVSLFLRHILRTHLDGSESFTLSKTPSSETMVVPPQRKEPSVTPSSNIINQDALLQALSPVVSPIISSLESLLSKFSSKKSRTHTCV